MEDDSRAHETPQEGKAHDQETQTTFDMNGSVINRQQSSMHVPVSSTDRSHPGFSAVPWDARYSCQPPGYPDNYYRYEAGYPTPTPPPHHHAPYYSGRTPHWHHPESGPVYPQNHPTPIVQVTPHKPNEYPARRNFYPPSPADIPPQRHPEIARPKAEWPARTYHQFPKPIIPAHYLASVHNAHRNAHSEYGGPPSTATSLRSTVLDVPGSNISSPRASAPLNRKRARSNTPASSIESIDLNMLIRNSPDSLLGCLAGSRLSSAGSFGHLSPLGFCTSSAYNRSGSATMQSGRPTPFITPPPIQPIKSTKIKEQPRDVYPSSTTDIPKEEATVENMSCVTSPPTSKMVDGSTSMKEESMETGQLDSTTSPVASEIPVGSDNEADEGQGEVEEPNLTCHWRDCTITYDNQADLVTHVNGDHIKKEKRDFTCYWQDCCREQKPFKAQYMLVVHMRRHTGEKPHICKYEGCTKAYSRLENLKTHLRSHTGERPYVCEVKDCSKAFSNASDRAKHQNRTHSSVKPYVCKVPDCPKRYTDPSSLRKHTKTVHGDPGVKRLKSDSGKDKETQSTTKNPTSNSSTHSSSNNNTTNTMVQSPSSDVKSPGSGSGSAGTIKKAGGHSSSIVSNSCNTELVSSTCDIGSPSVDIPGSYEGSLGVSQPPPSGVSPRSPPYISNLPDIAEGDWEPGANESAVTTVQPIACERQSQTVILPKIHSKTHDIASWVNEVHRRMSQTSTRRSSESSQLSADLTGDVSRRSSESGWASNNGSRRSSQTSLNPPTVPHPPNAQVLPGNKVSQGSTPRAIKTLLPPVNDGDLRRASETSNTSSQLSRTFNRLSRSSSGYGSQSNLAIIRSPMFHRVPYPLQKESFPQRMNDQDKTFRRLSDTVVCEADSSEMSRKCNGNKEEYRRRSEPAQNVRSTARQDPPVPLSCSFPSNEAEPRETELINEVVDPNEFDAYLTPEQLQPMARQTQPLRHFPYPPEDVHPQPQQPVESQTIHYRPNQFSARTIMTNSYYPPQNNPSPSPNIMQYQRYNSQYTRLEHQYYQRQTRLQSVPQGQMITQYQQRPPPVMGYYDDSMSGQPQDHGPSAENYEAMLNGMEGLSTNGGPDMNVFGLGNGNMVINDMNTLLNSLLEEDKYLEMQQNSHRMAGSAMSTGTLF